MKKMKQITVATTVALMALLLAFLVGCNSNPKEIANYGYTLLNDYDDEGNEITDESKMSVYMSMSVVFYSNNTLTFTITQEESKTVSGTYKGDPTKNDDITGTLTATVEGQTQTENFTAKILNEVITSFEVGEQEMIDEGMPAMKKGGNTVKYSEL